MKQYCVRFANPDEVELILAGTSNMDYATFITGDIVLLSNQPIPKCMHCGMAIDADTGLNIAGDSRCGVYAFDEDMQDELHDWDRYWDE